jgi:hypothetical protein
MNAALLNALVGVAVVVLPVVGTMIVQALRRLSAKWELQATAQNTANMESDLRTVLNVGIAKALPLIETKGWSSPAVREAVLATAADYLRQRFPDRTGQIVAAAQTPWEKIPTAEAVIETLAARLPDAIAVAAASPATPPATLVNPGVSTHA